MTTMLVTYISLFLIRRKRVPYITIGVALKKIVFCICMYSGGHVSFFVQMWLLLEHDTSPPPPPSLKCLKTWNEGSGSFCHNGTFYLHLTHSW